MIERNRIYVLIKHIIPKKWNKKFSIEDTFHIYDTEEKKNYFIEHILQQEDGL